MRKQKWRRPAGARQATGVGRGGGGPERAPAAGTRHCRSRVIKTSPEIISPKKRLPLSPPTPGAPSPPGGGGPPAAPIAVRRSGGAHRPTCRRHGRPGWRAARWRSAAIRPGGGPSQVESETGPRIRNAGAGRGAGGRGAHEELEGAAGRLDFIVERHSGGRRRRRAGASAQQAAKGGGGASSVT